MRRLVALAAAAALVLSGCSGGGLTPEERLQDRTATVVDQANARDLAGLRAAAQDLRTEIEDQVRRSELNRARASLLLKLVSAVERDASLVRGEPTPEPTPTETPSASPTPSESPSTSPSPSPSASPTPSPTPVQTSPVVIPTLSSPTASPTPPPAAVTSPAPLVNP